MFASTSRFPIMVDHSLSLSFSLAIAAHEILKEKLNAKSLSEVADNFFSFVRFQGLEHEHGLLWRV
jgi:hypothetical protein